MNRGDIALREKSGYGTPETAGTAGVGGGREQVCEGRSRGVQDQRARGAGRGPGEPTEQRTIGALRLTTVRTAAVAYVCVTITKN